MLVYSGTWCRTQSAFHLRGSHSNAIFCEQQQEKDARSQHIIHIKPEYTQRSVFCRPKLIFIKSLGFHASSVLLCPS